jgi:hypothetical protein
MAASDTLPVRTRWVIASVSAADQLGPEPAQDPDSRADQPSTQLNRGRSQPMGGCKRRKKSAVVGNR